MCIKKEDKWLKFKKIREKPKTNVYSVISKCNDYELGEIAWYPQWRHYCFFPSFRDQTVHSDRCLISIGEFILALNTEHKKARNV